MSTIAVEIKTGAAVATPEAFVQAAVDGNVKFYTQRGNDTFRHVQFLPDGSSEREVAEWVSEQRDAGRTMKDIAAEMHQSVPTVRRMINALTLTEEVESYDAEDIADLVESGTIEA